MGRNTACKVVLFANTDWYLFNFRRSLALELQRCGYEVLMLSPPGEYGTRLCALGLRWEPFPMLRRSLHPLRELGVVWRLVRLFRRERPALVHGFTIKCAVYGALAARFARVPARVSAVEGLGYVFSSTDWKARALRPIVRALFRLALRGRQTRLILLNQDDVAAFRRGRMAYADDVRLIYGAGVDCARFAPRSVVGSSARPLRVLLAARMLWDKGVAEYVNAARAFRERGGQVRFLLAGTPDTGNPAAVPEVVLRGWVDEGLVDWLGHVDDMAALLQTVDIVALPSYREGLPTSLTEGAACGLPLVTCDTPGCREVVTNGVDGLLVPPRDAGALTNAIARLVDSPELRGRLGRAARAKALAEFDEKTVIEKTLAVYRELLESLGHPPPIRVKPVRSE